MTENRGGRSAPARPLPPYSFVPGHDLPHPLTDPRGHLHCSTSHDRAISLDILARLPGEPTDRRRFLAAILATNPQWLYALELFNGGFYWEAHEVWESFWHALGRTTPEARFVQGLIRLAAACVKIREGGTEGVRRHTQRSRELLGDIGAIRGADDLDSVAVGLAPESIRAVLSELERYRPECWHTARTPVVRVVGAALRLAG